MVYSATGIQPVICAWRAVRASSQRSTWTDQLVRIMHSLISNARLRSLSCGKSTNLERYDRTCFHQKVRSG